MCSSEFNQFYFPILNLCVKSNCLLSCYCLYKNKIYVVRCFMWFVASREMFPFFTKGRQAGSSSNRQPLAWPWLVALYSPKPRILFSLRNIWNNTKKFVFIYCISQLVDLVVPEKRWKNKNEAEARGIIVKSEDEGIYSTVWWYLLIVIVLKDQVSVWLRHSFSCCTQTRQTNRRPRRGKTFFWGSEKIGVGRRWMAKERKALTRHKKYRRGLESV